MLSGVRRWFFLSHTASAVLRCQTQDVWAVGEC